MLSWASWLTSVCATGLLAWLGFHRRKLERWVSWLPLVLIPVLIAIGSGEPLWILVLTSALVLYGAIGALIVARWNISKDDRHGFRTVDAPLQKYE
jgi:hypothetical protein